MCVLEYGALRISPTNEDLMLCGKVCLAPQREDIGDGDSHFRLGNQCVRVLEARAEEFEPSQCSRLKPLVLVLNR